MYLYIYIIYSTYIIHIQYIYSYIYSLYICCIYVVYSYIYIVRYSYIYSYIQLYIVIHIVIHSYIQLYIYSYIQLYLVSYSFIQLINMFHAMFATYLTVGIECAEGKSFRVPDPPDPPPQKALRVTIFASLMAPTGRKVQIGSGTCCVKPW